AETSQTYALILKDFDKDGDVDVVVGNVAGANKVYLNDGLGNIIKNAEFGLKDGNTYALASGDINGDGLDDIITGNSGPGNSVFYQLKPKK
ncbi:MAG: FG-GAP repeat protein, partial [Sphingomonadales bacterium]